MQADLPQQRGAQRPADWPQRASHASAPCWPSPALQISRLLAESFAGFEGLYDEDAASPSPAAVLQYQLKLLAALQWRASTLGRRFVTVTAVDADSGELAGVANVTPGLVIAEASDHVLLGPGQAAAAVSNMAVAPQHRRRGLARLMLAACERAAAGFSPPATLMGLVVYRYNDAGALQWGACIACIECGTLLVPHRAHMPPRVPAMPCCSQRAVREQWLPPR